MNTIKENDFDYESYTRDNAPDALQIRQGSEAHKRRREAFKKRLINHANRELKLAREMRHVFISYCHENKDLVDRLCHTLISKGVDIWVDWDNLEPGIPWRQAIQKAIQHGDFFIACFSKEYNVRDTTFMKEELSIAIEILQQNPFDEIWFIPVKLNECQIPDIKIGEGRTLQELQYVNLYEDWETGIQQILKAMPSSNTELINAADSQENNGENCVLFRSVNGKLFFIPFQEVQWDTQSISLMLSPVSSEQTSFLCSMRKGKHDVLAFAHQEDAVWVKPREVSQVSTEDRTVWEVILTEDTTGKAFKHRTEKVYTEYITLDQIAVLRARRLLLDEKIEAASSSLTQSSIFNQMLLETQIRGELSSQYGNRLQALTSPIPELYQHFKNSPETFLKYARLLSILYLRLTNTVEDIHQLDLKLVKPTDLQVEFKGQRPQLYVDEKTTLIEIEGICPLPEKNLNT